MRFGSCCADFHSSNGDRDLGCSRGDAPSRELLTNKSDVAFGRGRSFRVSMAGRRLPRRLTPRASSGRAPACDARGAAAAGASVATMSSLRRRELVRCVSPK
mmetsp:Transcript_27294/g.69442  ORF Transcript_27294/g.69442 Transcript_27294/m.69442 type:complete len:102 (+) Transcript_27294:464-769(+)